MESGQGSLSMIGSWPDDVMQVILQKTVSNLGLVGEVVNVKPGYYRNFLAPRELATIAVTSNVKQWEHKKKVTEARKTKEKAGATEIKTR
jgi:large subunit ribosomal protein L9